MPGHTYKEDHFLTLEILKSGEMNISEIAKLSGRSHRLISYWAKRSNIDCKKVRLEWCQRKWEELKRREYE